MGRSGIFGSAEVFQSNMFKPCRSRNPLAGRVLAASPPVIEKS
jgi:hypothetical protein